MSDFAHSNAVNATFAAWKERAARVGGRDTMLHFRDSRDGSIDLSGAHPSGLAQLLAGRSTRLSSLIRDPEHISDARRRAHSIRQKAVQLSYERGINTAHLAIGFANWTREIDGTRNDFAAPILLRHVTLVPRGAEDFEVVLADDVILNPALVEYLKTQHNISIDVDEWIEATGNSHGFDPAPVLDRLRKATRTVPGFLVNQRLVIATFANIATPFTREDFPADHPILRALAGDAATRRALGGDDAAAEVPAAERRDGSLGAGEDKGAGADRGEAGVVGSGSQSADADAAEKAGADAASSQDESAQDATANSEIDSARDASAQEIAEQDTPAQGADEPAQDASAQEKAEQDNSAQDAQGADDADSAKSEAAGQDSAGEETPEKDSADTDSEDAKAADTAAAEKDSAESDATAVKAAAEKPAADAQPAENKTEKDMPAKAESDTDSAQAEPAAQPSGQKKSTADKSTAEKNTDDKSKDAAPTPSAVLGAGAKDKNLGRLDASSAKTAAPTAARTTDKEAEKGADTSAAVKKPARKRSAPAPLPDRAPHEEFLALDVDGDQQAVVDAAVTGDSFVVDTPPGTGATQVAVAVATTLAHLGRSVLYVAQSSDALDDFQARMRTAGLDDFTIDGRLREGDLKRQLIGLILDAERAKKPDLSDLVEELGELRARLADHRDSMHRIREPWGVSVHATMERLAELTAEDPGPLTSVRFGGRIMELDTTGREALRAKLLDFSERGAFTMDVEDTVWFGARFDTDKEAETARAAAARAADIIPHLTQKVEPVLQRAGLNPPRSIGDWGASLELLVATSETLNTFTPAVYEADLDALIAATGTSLYRRENNIDQGLFERGRLKREAKELLTGSANPEDLHRLLFKAREERDEWAQLSNSEPSVPTGLTKAHELYQQLRKHLDHLSPVLADTPDGGDLDGMLVEELHARLEALGEDRAALADLPARTRLESSLRADGLGALLADLRARKVRHSMVGAEFDLAYWATVLQQMASEDPEIGGHDSAELHQLAQDYRQADLAYVKAGASRLKASHAGHWRKAIADFKSEAEALRSGLRANHLHVDQLAADAPHVLSALAPVWMMSPFDVPNYFTNGQFFDTVILADSARLAVPEALPAIARARQVIALGDDRLPGPREFSVAVNRHVEPREPEKDSVFGALAEFLPVHSLHTSHRVAPRGLIDLANTFFYDSAIDMVPTALTSEGSGLEFAFVPDALGSPDSATGQVESPDQEVSRVVDLVLRHARTKARQSLAVVTLTPWHAQRVAAALQEAIRAYPYVASFFTDSSKEPFIVTDAEKAQAIARDAIIFSIGYGRSLQGRVLYNFGALDKPGSERLLAAVMTRARRKLTVVSGFEPGDFEPARLHHGAALLPELLAAVVAGSRKSANETDSPERFADPLVADIAARLNRRGVAPIQGYGGVDLALPVGKSEEQGMALAVETDGRAYAATQSIRERERLRPESLTRRGWTYLRLWSTDAFVDPQVQADRIFDAWKESVEARSPQSVLDAARAAAVVTNRRGSRPKITSGLPLHAYSDTELDDMLIWIQSDGVFRDDDELAEQLEIALAYRGKSADLSDVVGKAVRRYREAIEKESADRRAEDEQSQSADGADQQAGAGQAAAPAEQNMHVLDEAEVMPGYDTGMLRDSDLIDAGLREDEIDTDGSSEED